MDDEPKHYVDHLREAEQKIAELKEELFKSTQCWMIENEMLKAELAKVVSKYEQDMERMEGNLKQAHSEIAKYKDDVMEHRRAFAEVATELELRGEMRTDKDVIDGQERYIAELKSKVFSQEKEIDALNGENEKLQIKLLEWKAEAHRWQAMHTELEKALGETE